MVDGKDLKKILKWAGIVALVVLPVVVILKKRKAQSADRSDDEEADVYSAELKD